MWATPSSSLPTSGPGRVSTLLALSFCVSSITFNPSPSPRPAILLSPYHGHQHEDTDQHRIQGGLPQQDLIQDGGRQDSLIIRCYWQEGRAARYLWAGISGLHIPHPLPRWVGSLVSGSGAKTVGDGEKEGEGPLPEEMPHSERKRGREMDEQMKTCQPCSQHRLQAQTRGHLAPSSSCCASGATVPLQFMGPGSAEGDDGATARSRPAAQASRKGPGCKAVLGRGPGEEKLAPGALFSCMVGPRLPAPFPLFWTWSF